MGQTDVQELLRQGSAAARVGDRKAAREYFTRVTELDADNEEGWLGLAGVVDEMEEKRACFERVLAINPDNSEAQAGLTWVRRKEAESQSSPAAAVTRPVVEPAPQPEESGQVLYCANHPQTETLLRCNRCDKPICPRCAVRTPVGFRCRQCVGQQQAVYFTARPLDYVVAAGVGLVLSVIAGAIMTPLGWFFALFLGPLAGGLIAEAVRWAIGRRRGRYVWLVVSGCVVVGALLAGLPGLLLSLFALPQLGPEHAATALGSLIFRVNIVYIVLAVGTVYARLK